MVPDPSGYQGAESQIAVSQDDPNKLVMVARSGGPASAPTATSSDGGMSWTPFTLDTNLPSHDVKSFFAMDSNGTYLFSDTTGQPRRTAGRPLSVPPVARPVGGTAAWALIRTYDRGGPP
ncbi:hypothetical protein [Streptomyces sp. NPDC058755]|uniref:hypothetical protein n=1 Tax=Streptomyces sp. NPDC058755 TaxID=3346624 RepID=UPI003673D624